MGITKTVTKKVLEKIISNTFSKFGSISSSSLLDSLKLLGFYYATNAGISINIEDLKTPNSKKEFLDNASQNMSEVSDLWEQGIISDTERFQSIIDGWNSATEALKNRIIDYYENFDPANNLYVMAFSGARGNMSQVRQLVGMRGLMADQEGKIIDLPIQSNFREGLSSIDYIISSYGARKGIVDTALKTADSGYLTRRLIYVAQDLVIREFDCNSKKGILFFLTKNSSTNNILGRVFLESKKQTFPYQLQSLDLLDKDDITEKILTKKMISFLKGYSPLILSIRSPLTCNSIGSICQKCYGWDLARQKLITLGEAVGIIAAQSIGEPGTQLTMRTFHTGGIFTSETVKQIFAPFSGKLIVPRDFKAISYRTSHGQVVLKLQQEVIIQLVNWKGVIKDIFLEIGSFFYIKSSTFVKKGEVICEYSTRSTVAGSRRLKPIYTKISGEIKFENLSLLTIAIPEKKNISKVTQDDGIIWLAAGKIFPLPKEVDYKFPKKLLKTKSFAQLKIVIPYEGVINVNSKSFSLLTEDDKISIFFSEFENNFLNCTLSFSSFLKNYQYIDKFTTIGCISIYSNYEGEIYSVRKKLAEDIVTFFLITESDIWKITSDQVTNFFSEKNKKVLNRSENFLNLNTKLIQSGFFLKKEGFQMVFQNAIPLFLSVGTIINYKKGDLALKNSLFGTLINSTQQTEDIVQGLPKIEELIEARKPKLKNFLAKKPGILLNSVHLNSDYSNIQTTFKEKVISCEYQLDYSLDGKENEKEKKSSYVPILTSLISRKNLGICNEKFVKITLFPIKEIRNNETKNKEYIVIDKQKKKNLISKQKSISFLWPHDRKSIENILYRYKQNEIIEWEKLKRTKVVGNKKTNLDDYYIFETTRKEFLHLQNVNPITFHKLSDTARKIGKIGDFIDIGEPLTEGSIDIHELLSIFFNYHSLLDGLLLGITRSLNKFQLIFVNSIQAIYQSQNVTISSKHVEIIVRQMTAKVIITESGNTPFLAGEIITLSLIKEIYKTFKWYQKEKQYKTPKFEPLLLSTTNSSLTKDGFLAAAGFQETKKILTKSALEGTSDWLRGLKECVIIGRLIPAGSSFLNYKNYLDTIYLFKD